MRLPWNLSPIEADQTRFRKCLGESLRQVAAGAAYDPHGPVRSRYRILSRWRTYYGWGIMPGDVDAHGSVIVARRPSPGGWDCRVQIENGMSGETTDMSFTTDATALRALCGEWRIQSHYRNDHNTVGALQTYRCDGRIAADGEIRLRMRNGLDFAAGSISPRRPLLAGWSLLDSIACMAGREFSLLDRLECLKPVARVRRLSEWLCDLGPVPLNLTCHVLEGEGLEPRYWWLDQQGRVIFITTTLNVYALEECVAASHEDFPPGSTDTPRPATPAPVPARSSAAKPNILFINTDQQTWDAIGALGNGRVRTPAIDWLLNNGMRFGRSYCTDPVCCSARSSWATGLYSSETGCVFNGGLIHEDAPDIAQILRKSSEYLPLHSGKWHVDGRYLPEVGQFQLLYFGRRHIGASAGETYDPSSVRAALDFLDTHDGKRPFYLQLGLIDPHDICEYLHSHEHSAVPDPVAIGLAAPDDLPPLPPNFELRFRELILHEAAHRDGAGNLVHAAIRQGIRDWTSNDWRGLAWHLYRHVERADQNIALVLNALAQTPFRDDTLIVFSVDHGEAGGRHQLFQKFSLYEEAIRVPFVVAEFGRRFGIRKGSVDDQHFVSGVDLTPTIIDFAGATAPARMSGRSLRPLIEGREPADWPDHAYVESNYWGRAIVTRRFKYIMEYRPRTEDDTPPRMATHEIGRELLFDLESDPWETRDAAESFPAELQRCRDILRRRETTLQTRPLRDQSRGQVDSWRKRLLARWQQTGSGMTL